MFLQNVSGNMKSNNSSSKSSKSKKNQEKSKKVMFIQFIVFSVIGLLITELLLFIFIDKMMINEMVSKIIATAIVMVFNFVTRKMFLE